MDESRVISAVSDYPELYNSTLPLYRDLTTKAKAWRAVSLQTGLSEDDCRRKWKSLRDTYIRLHRRRAAGDKPPPWKHFRSLAFITPYMRSMPHHPHSATYPLEEEEEEEDKEEEEEDKEEEEDEEQEERLPRQGERKCRRVVVVKEEVEEEEERNGESATTTDNNSAFIIHEVEDDQADPDYHPSPCSAAPPPHRGPVSNGPGRKRGRQGQGGSREDMEDEMFLVSLLPYLRRLSYTKKSAVKLKIHQVLYDAEFK